MQLILLTTGPHQPSNQGLHDVCLWSNSSLLLVDLIYRYGPNSLSGSHSVSLTAGLFIAEHARQCALSICQKPTLLRRGKVIWIWVMSLFSRITSQCLIEHTGFKPASIIGSKLGYIWLWWLSMSFDDTNSKIWNALNWKCTVRCLFLCLCFVEQRAYTFRRVSCHLRPVMGYLQSQTRPLRRSPLTSA